MFLVIKLFLLAVLIINGLALNIKENPFMDDHLDTGAPSSYSQVASNIHEEEFSLNGSLYHEENFEGLLINYNLTSLPKCPNGLHLNQSIQDNSCIFITGLTIFPPKCPHPNTLDYYTFLKKGAGPVTAQEHWLYTPRNTSNIDKKHCLTVTRGINNNSTIDPKNCNNAYHGVCIYDPDQFYQQSSMDYCVNRYNTSCISYNFNSMVKCYCKIEFQGKNLPRKSFCRKLVEIIDPYQNNFLVKLLDNKKPCWIGLDKYRNTYQWYRTKTTTNYTFWSDQVDINKPYGALSPEGWLLEEEGALNCAICEIEDEDPPRVQIHISHNNTLDVNITNPVGVYQYVDCCSQNSYNCKKIYPDPNTPIEKLPFSFGTSAYYWCKALQIPHLTPIFSNTLFIPSKYGHEFALSVMDSYPDIPFPDLTDDLPCNPIIEKLSEIVLYSEPTELINYNVTNKTLEVLCHITIKPTGMSRTEELNMILNRLKDSNIKVTNLRRIRACLASETIINNQILHWPETPVGNTTIPTESCIQEDGSRVTRTCTENYYNGSQWDEPNGTCTDLINSNRTHFLYKLLNSYSKSLSPALVELTKSCNDFNSSEINLLSQVLEKLASSSETIKISQITNTINNIMNFEPKELENAQRTFNSTDMMLYSLDTILERIKINDSGYSSEVSENLLVQISNLEKSNMTGIKMEKTQLFNSSKVIPLQIETSEKDLIRENFEVAVLISQTLHKDIISCLNKEETPKLITTQFLKDSFFNEQNKSNYHVDGNIIGVTIPYFNCTFNTPLKIIFNSPSNSSTNLKCASWVFGINHTMKKTYGRWVSESVPERLGNSTYFLCKFKHVTHFSLLISNNKIYGVQKKALDIITAIGCGLSLLGLFMVFLTAIIFKRFRSINAIVLNFAVAVTGQIILLFLADHFQNDDVLCTIFGAALHFIVLAQFCWMLTIAILQYRRYVIVFSNPTKHLVAKMCTFSWGVPLIVVITIISISRENYGKENNFCYAIGNYFIFGVVIPIAIIIFINLIIFLRIMLSIASSRKMKVHQKNDDTSSLQLRLAIMLFFMLGLTWGFGLLAGITGEIIYSYLFCITATLQGFILFLYFIVLNDKTRSLWTNLIICNFKCISNEYNNFNNESTQTTLERKTRKNITDNNTSTTEF